MMYCLVCRGKCIHIAFYVSDNQFTESHLRSLEQDRLTNENENELLLVNFMSIRCVMLESQTSCTSTNLKQHLIFLKCYIHEVFSGFGGNVLHGCGGLSLLCTVPVLN